MKNNKQLQIYLELLVNNTVFTKHGKREIPSRYLITLAKYYHTSTDYILELTDYSRPYHK